MVPTLPASVPIQWVAQSGYQGHELEDQVKENWERARRACEAIPAKVLHDAWLKSFSPGQIAKMLNLSTSYVGRLIAYGCVVDLLLDRDEPWDVLPTERSMRAYISEARENVCIGLDLTKVIHDRDLMAEVASEAIRASERAATAATLPATGELVHVPRKHEKQREAESLKAGKRGTQTLMRMAKALEATIAKHGALDDYLRASGPEEAEKLRWYIKKIHRTTGELLDEMAGGTQ